MKHKPALGSKMFLGISLLLALLWLAGCKGKIESGVQAPKPAKPVAESTAEEEVAGAKKLAWSYDPTGKRDPFMLADQKSRIVPPGIESVNLDQMYIDGIIVGAGRDVAHVILPDNSDWFVKVGDVIGLNRGVVKQILSDGIVVEEQYLDPVDPQKIRIVEKVLRMEPVGSAAPHK